MSVDEPRPNRRMTDMGPRRMDGFAGPARPAQPQRPIEPMRQAAPAAPTRLQRPQPLQQPQSQPVRQQQPVDARPPAYQQPQPDAAPPKQSGKWMVVLQFVIGLLVIAGVAGAIVYLYIKYYQQ